MKTLHEVALQNLLDQGAKEGSTLKVIAKAESGTGGWGNGWSEMMDQYVGKELKVRQIQPDNIGVYLRTPDGNSWVFPAFCLEMVKEEEKPQPQPEPAKLPPPSERPDLYEPFNLDHAMKGRPVVEINGEKAIAIYHIKEAAGTENELAVVFEMGDVVTYTIDGRLWDNKDVKLFHPKEETQNTWVNLYRKSNGDLVCGNAEYDSLEIAMKKVNEFIGKYLTTTEIPSTPKW